MSDDKPEGWHLGGPFPRWMRKAARFIAIQGAVVLAILCALAVGGGIMAYLDEANASEAAQANGETRSCTVDELKPLSNLREWRRMRNYVFGSDLETGACMQDMVPVEECKAYWEENLGTEDYPVSRLRLMRINVNCALAETLFSDHYPNCKEAQEFKMKWLGDGVRLLFIQKRMEIDDSVPTFKETGWSKDDSMCNALSPMEFFAVFNKVTE